MPSKIENTLVIADQVCDYIPLVSTISNLVDLFLKNVFIPHIYKFERLDHNYYTHLEKKSSFHCKLLLIPLIGNIYVIILRMSDRKIKAKNENFYTPSKYDYLYSSHTQFISRKKYEEVPIIDAKSRYLVPSNDQQCSLSKLSDDIKIQILKKLFPQDSHYSNLTRYALNFKKLTVINKNFQRLVNKELDNLHQVLLLMEKTFRCYNKYSYEDCVYPITLRKSYIPEMEKEILEIVSLMPESLTHRRPFLFGLYTPLMIACFIENIPIELIEQLLLQGADPNATAVLSNQKEVSAFSHLKKSRGRISEERLIAVEKLLIKYKYNPPLVT